MKQFQNLSIRPELLQTLKAQEYSDMTPVQDAGIPPILQGLDVLAEAKTGSGKTVAFAVGLLNKLDPQSYNTQALVLCPTRELADQVTAVIRQLAGSMSNTKVLSLCGGKPMQGQLASLQRNAHVIVGTPGRVLKHLQKQSLHLESLDTLVLDEADRMLDMGFYDDIERILAFTPEARQTLLFSATYSDEIKTVSRAFQKKPLEVKVEKSHHNEKIRQVFYAVSEEKKEAALISVLQHYKPLQCIVFCNQKIHCQQLSETLQQRGFSALALHGDLDQYERDQAIIRFANSSCSLLIATDVAARGLDIKDLPAVINYDLTADPEMHVHRIGRTGRAGNEGLAVSLVLPFEQFRLEAIEEFQGSTAVSGDINSLAGHDSKVLKPPMITLQISAGRKDKIRPGDILGALTAAAESQQVEIASEQIGKITIVDKSAYVAVQRPIAIDALNKLSHGKIKGRKFKVKILS